MMHTEIQHKSSLPSDPAMNDKASYDSKNVTITKSNLENENT